ncbi:MAG: FAD-dependent oxidoreductase, partial [Deltaproteobacteria bacterium]|nr:FAD-dependent oxidoreductase [Deltaproteobacteria bacterium]
MTDYEELLEKNMPAWPYPVNYGKENEVSADILIVGGGIAGCHAAINAAKRGMKVAVVDKAPIVRSGSGGAGVDHWHCVNPYSTTTVEDSVKHVPPYSMGHLRYIIQKESWKALLDIEKMGVKIRDEDDEFVGAPFRDEETKFLFAYDYNRKDVFRILGADIKPAMYKELKRLGVELYERIMCTSLLNEEGKQGSRIVGATGMNIRTGEFYIFKAKATLLSTAQPLKIWVFNTELAGAHTAHDDPNLAGDGNAMGWLAGAELAMMERSQQSSGPFRYPAYGTGNMSNTWFPCSIVDADGKEIPYVDREGNIIETVEERSLRGGAGGPGGPGVGLIRDLPERIEKGEYKLPFYADLPGMPEDERRAIFGLMVGHEGKTRIPVYETYTQNGFDPDKDMLQANVLPPKLAGKSGPWWDHKSNLHSAPQWRDTAFNWGGGLLVGWDMKSNLEGLFAAGNQTAGGGGHAGAAGVGRYVGRILAAYASEASDPVVERKQVEDEKERVYAPVGREGNIGWKELQAGLCRIMQDYCGEYRSEEVLKAGLWYLQSIKEGEASCTYIRNPHELARYLECMVRLTVSEIMMHASIARKASSNPLDFKRLDCSDVDQEEWTKFVTVKMEDDEVKVGEKPIDFWLQEPYAPSY